MNSLKVILINMIVILMILAKLATPARYKIKVFKNKGFNVTIFVHGFNNKISSYDSNYIVNYVVDVVMWSNFGNCIIYMRKVVIVAVS